MEFYVYSTSRWTPILSWHSFTGDPFYGKDRHFRWELTVFGYVLNLQWWKNRRFL